MNPILKYCLFAFYLSLSGSLFAQSFISENKLWRYSSKVCPGGTLGPDCTLFNSAFKFQGDSVINDTTYVRILKATNESLSDWKLCALWRETKDMKIYSRHLFWQKEELLYDFSFIKGDTLKLLSGGAFVVDSVSTKMWGGKMRKHWYLNPPHAEGDPVNPGYSTTWIEDVGQENFFMYSTRGYIGAFNYFLCFYEDGEQVYNNPEFNTCFYTSASGIKVLKERYQLYPNPVSDKLFIATNQPNKGDLSIELYSIKGELIRKECFDSGSNPIQVNLSSLKSGSYVLRLMAESGMLEEKIIIKK